MDKLNLEALIENKDKALDYCLERAHHYFYYEHYVHMIEAGIARDEILQEMTELVEKIKKLDFSINKYFNEYKEIVKNTNIDAINNLSTKEMDLIRKEINEKLS